eukprot:TRINITY_DN75136_c0_g1_i1.p1 TRINITY_DN75136_c0_g1~~TRINITY_DN75136_c0_g1_i1.p1  ORF type:complete len:443 (-),score=48.15 TRINITY_DN75136_c0_g1_i1:99-1427(-)
MNKLLCVCLVVLPVRAALPRNVRIQGQEFVVAKTNVSIVMSGPNVVVKGPPYLPMVAGDRVCNDNVNSKACGKTGTCTSCSTFNQADVDHIKSLGWNFIRLGVVWAGAQPRDEDALDPKFLELLHAVLDLTDANGIHVMLDNHGDMVGTAGCGNGSPMWVQQAAAPELIGQPLKTELPYSLVKDLRVTDLGGWAHCGNDAAKWAEHAGDPNYNLLNSCCQALNDDNPGALGYTTISQKTMDYLLMPGKGRDAFVRYWRLMAEAVKGHPSAFAAELMNEPMSIRRNYMFETWQACTEAITTVIPDMSVSVADVGEASILPAWITEITGGTIAIPSDIVKWMKASNNVFYAWHYGDPIKSIKNMQEISSAWNMPTFGTETGCDLFDAALSAGISASYWHYSAYCNTGPDFGNRAVPEDTFGACILGWAGGNSSKCAGDTGLTLV